MGLTVVLLVLGVTAVVGGIRVIVFATGDDELFFCHCTDINGRK